MIFAILTIILPISLFARATATLPQSTPAAPKNLRVLTPDVNLREVMEKVNAALGVQCTYCHAGTDYASDLNPKKEIARNMFRLTKQIAGNFPDSGNDFLRSRYLPFPEGKQYVTCATCHHGSVTPVSAVPDPHGPPRAPEPGAPAGARGAVAQGGNPQRAAIDATSLRPGRGVTQHKNMVWLPADTDTMLVMPAFRAALGVECNFCHVSGEAMERGHADERHLDESPKKLIARNMIRMTQRINDFLFPGGEVDIVFASSSIVPEGKHYVTCYTCHRGASRPSADGIR